MSYTKVGTTKYGRGVYINNSWLGKLLSATHTEGTMYSSFNLWARWCESKMLFVNPVYDIPSINTGELIFKRYWFVAVFHCDDLPKRLWFCWDAGPETGYLAMLADMKPIRNWVLFPTSRILWMLFKYIGRPISRWYRHGEFRWMP